MFVYVFLLLLHFYGTLFTNSIIFSFYFTSCLHELRHVFATIGDPGKLPHKEVVVADAWVKYARPVTLDQHFCGGDTSLRVIKKKSGKKQEMLPLLGKYPCIQTETLNPVPSYVADILKMWGYTKESLILQRYMWQNLTPE